MNLEKKFESLHCHFRYSENARHEEGKGRSQKKFCMERRKKDRKRTGFKRVPSPEAKRKKGGSLSRLLGGGKEGCGVTTSSRLKKHVMQGVEAVKEG